MKIYIQPVDVLFQKNIHTPSMKGLLVCTCFSSTILGTKTLLLLPGHWNFQWFNLHGRGGERGDLEPDTGIVNGWQSIIITGIHVSNYISTCACTFINLGSRYNEKKKAAVDPVHSITMYRTNLGLKMWKQQRQTLLKGIENKLRLIHVPIWGINNGSTTDIFI